MTRGRLLQGDCLAVLPTLGDGSVDMVFADLPYGITDNPWDCAIPLDRLWPELRRVGKPSCVLVFTATMRFANTLINSHPATFRYDLTWEKTKAQGHLSANNRPLRAHEHVLVFSRTKGYYCPQKNQYSTKGRGSGKNICENYGKSRGGHRVWKCDGTRHPRSVIHFGEDRASRAGVAHPTQKPVALLRWLIATYSRPGDTVLDPASGVASTAIAALREGRRFVCIERDAGYYAKGCERVRAELAQGELPLAAAEPAPASACV